MVVLLSGASAAADDKAIEELKARLDRLEKQNEELKKKLEGKQPPSTRMKLAALQRGASMSGVGRPSRFEISGNQRPDHRLQPLTLGG